VDEVWKKGKDRTPEGNVRYVIKGMTGLGTTLYRYGQAAAATGAIETMYFL
jgi:hypothetical protein